MQQNQPVKLPPSQPAQKWLTLLTIFLLVLVLSAGVYFRIVGIDWDEGRHLHPDERFLSMVLNAIEPVQNVKEYFNTATSSLNPGNRGFNFFVYGTLPIFIIRYVGEWVGQTGYDPITIVGRQLSVLAEVLTILLVFLVGLRLYNRWIGLLAAAFYSAAVLPIQQAHFMTVDTFTSMFGMLTVLAAVIIAQHQPSLQNLAPGERYKIRFGDVWPYLLFGLGLGMATASKVIAASLALLLPLVEIVRYIKTPRELRAEQFSFLWKMVVLAAFVSLVTFRIGQPYTFTGPGIFNIGINQEWLAGMKSLQGQSSGAVDFPPALQWARRPYTFSIKNLVLWGLGIGLGLSAISGFVAMGWQVWRKKQYQHLPLWAWTGFFFLWQSVSWVKAMRYQLLIYPLLALIAGWGFWQLITRDHPMALRKWQVPARLTRALGVVLAMVAIVSTGLWAFAFTRIYTRPHSRISTTDWIYDNVKGPVNLVEQNAEGASFQQLPYRSNDFLNPGDTYAFSFTSPADGTLTQFSLPSATDLTQSGQEILFNAEVNVPERPLVTDSLPAIAQLPEPATMPSNANLLVFSFNPPVEVKNGQVYVITISHNSPTAQVYLSGVPTATIQGLDGNEQTVFLPKIVETIRPNHIYSMEVGVLKAGTINQVELPYLVDLAQDPKEKTLMVSLLPVGMDVASTATGQITGVFTDLGTGKGVSHVIALEKPLVIDTPRNIYVSFELTSGTGQLAISSVGPAIESSWDDALPVSKAGYVPYADSGGIFRGDLNLELYWPDDASKRDRFVQVLDQADYIFISSNRQWGTTTRVPERYPLTSQYYRSLLGCPEGTDLVTCYNRAEVGMYQGDLGFDLVYTGTSYPNLGSLSINDQFAEEAFSVYDHPKTLIFKKNTQYSTDNLKVILGSVDLTKVVNITAKQADDYKAGKNSPVNQLMLTDEELKTQQSGGTWADLFNRESILNQNQGLAVLVFYLFSCVLGWLVLPLVRLALPGLDDQGYPFAKLIGFLLLALFSFWLGSAGVLITKGTLVGVFGLIALLGLTAALLTRGVFLSDVKANWRKYLLIEVVSLAAFGMFLWIRYQNPDLWHPWRGGEKPMDFSYLNAIIKSSTFPAYDPWFAGGYINYYYYGQVIIAMPIKLLGVIPSTAYNIMLPLWYSLLISGAFGVGWNLYKAFGKPETLRVDGKPRVFGNALWAGLFTAALLGFLGNLGTVKLMVDGLKTLGAAGQLAEGAGLMREIGWLFKGLALYLQKVPLPVAQGSWYWNPSRTIPGDPITEFPFFTYLYADFHAHLIAMPIAILAVAWGLSALRSKGAHFTLGRKKWLNTLLGLTIGGMIIGALKPTNTWDYYTFLILNICILAYVGWMYLPPLKIGKLRLKPWQEKALTPLLLIVVLVLFTRVLYLPFNSLFFPGYTRIGFWAGDRTPLSSYVIHWGLILFLAFFWLLWETYQWMAVTPVSSLKKWEPYKHYLLGAAAVVGLALVFLLFSKVVVALVVVPLGLWTLLLLRRPNLPDGKRLALFMLGTALLLTLVVELVYLVGDIGRMNVVFKLYLQAWILFTLALGTAFVTLWHEQHRWTVRTQVLFQTPALVLIAGTLLFPLLGTLDKITDRMDINAPRTLDGMTYMATSKYYANGVELDLAEDYRAIQWMQDNVEGSPVILEAQAYEYQWGNRFTIYTGLPGVVGWNYHQRQQRAILRTEVVQQRVDSVNAFYMSQDTAFVREYLDKYAVKYIIVGQEEKAYYPGEALAKFAQLNGILWDAVYTDGNTVIYKVR